MRRGGCGAAPRVNPQARCTPDDFGGAPPIIRDGYDVGDLGGELVELLAQVVEGAAAAKNTDGGLVPMRLRVHLCGVVSKRERKANESGREM